MHKLALMLLAVVSCNVSAEWLEVGTVNSRGGYTVYADPSTFSKTGNVAKIWSLSDYKTAQTELSGISFLSAMTLTQYDCEREQVLNLAVSFHSENMRRGDVISSFTFNDQDWRPVWPGSTDERLWKLVCGKFNKGE